VLDVPAPDVLTEILDRWQTQRKTPAVLIVMDISGSMTDPASDGHPKPNSSWQASGHRCARSGSRTPTRSGLRVFSPTCSARKASTRLDLVPIGPIAKRARLADRIRNLQGREHAALRSPRRRLHDRWSTGTTRRRSTPSVLLTDGFNDDASAPTTKPSDRAHPRTPSGNERK